MNKYLYGNFKIRSRIVRVPRMDNHHTRDFWSSELFWREPPSCRGWQDVPTALFSWRKNNSHVLSYMTCAWNTFLLKEIHMRLPSCLVVGKENKSKIQHVMIVLTAGKQIFVKPGMWFAKHLPYWKQRANDRTLWHTATNINKPCVIKWAWRGQNIKTAILCDGVQGPGMARPGGRGDTSPMLILSWSNMAWVGQKVVWVGKKMI